VKGCGSWCAARQSHIGSSFAQLRTTAVRVVATDYVVGSCAVPEGRPLVAMDWTRGWRQLVIGFCSRWHTIPSHALRVNGERRSYSRALKEFPFKCSTSLTAVQVHTAARLVVISSASPPGWSGRRYGVQVTLAVLWLSQ
jgi:hypothetical protein